MAVALTASYVVATDFIIQDLKPTSSFISRYLYLCVSVSFNSNYTGIPSQCDCPLDKATAVEAAIRMKVQIHGLQHLLQIQWKIPSQHSRLHPCNVVMLHAHEKPSQ